MQVVVIGAQEVAAKLAALPEQVRRGIWDSTDRTVELEADAIREDTPRLTGTLAGGIQSDVTRSPDGARGRVFSDERYAPFVEHGTAKHGKARHMFERGSSATRPRAEDLFGHAIDETAARFG